jgi:hypothetical protein
MFFNGSEQTDSEVSDSSNILDMDELQIVRSLTNYVLSFSAKDSLGILRPSLNLKVAIRVRSQLKVCFPHGNSISEGLPKT